MQFQNTLAFARQLDKADPLKAFKSQFHHPKINGKPSIYLCGNSLGLQPRTTKKFIEQELADWAQLGVEGHVHGQRPWLYYHKFAKKSLTKLVGAKPLEVTSMNQLTVNLHLFLTTFYRPTQSRYKIICEAGAFSSDQYALESQVKIHGLSPDAAIVEIGPRPGEATLRTEDIEATIHQHGATVALVLFSGVQYYTGQFFNIGKITKAAHAVGAYAGFDLAHAVGNVPLTLHKHQVDFAVWCSYKYLNSGPGGVAGAFVHEKHARAFDLPRFAGWWGHNEKERFRMEKGFKSMPGVDGWQLSNYPVLSGAAHLASLELFDAAGIANLRKKSLSLTGFLTFLLMSVDPTEQHFTILTPTNEKERGCQLSLFMKKGGKKVHEAITAAGIISDWREPGVIRVAPVPLYNSFEDVFRFVEIFRGSLGK